VDEITASPPRFEYNHDEDLEDDPQLTLGNMKKFQANVRELTKFFVVSTTVEYFLLLWIFLETDCELLQQLANHSYLKSQKLKEIATDRQRIGLLEKENAALKKDKAALERKVKMLKEVIQKNRDGTEIHQRELQELRTAAQTVVDLIDKAEDTSSSLIDRLQRAPRRLPTTWPKLLGIM